MATKITKKEMLKVLLNSISDDFSATIQKEENAIEINAENARDFISHELELLNKKNSADKKPTKNQVENEIIKTAILAVMETNRMYTVSEIMKEVPECDELSNQRVTRIMHDLVNDNLVTRITNKRKALFQIKEVED